MPLSNTTGLRHAGFDEGLEAFRAEIEQFLPVVLFVFFGEPILRLGDFKFPFALDSDETDTKIRSAYPKGENLTIVRIYDDRKV